MRHIIEFVVFPEALGLDITGPLEVFQTATEILNHDRGDGKNGYKARFVAMKKGPVKLSSGLEVLANVSLDEPTRADTLLTPGGAGSRKAAGDPVFVEHIRKRAERVKRIISVCNGSFILAAAGLLDGKPATTHWLRAEEMARRFPKVNVVPDAIFTKSGNIYTSAGVTAGIDLALAVVEEDHGPAVAMQAARILVLYYRRPGTQSQFSEPLKAREAAGERFSLLHGWLVDNLDQPVTVERMADVSAMSPRNFSRVFKAATGMTPIKYLETLRLDRAREVLSSGEESLDRVAEISGFGRTERLRRAFLRRFNVTPSQYRLHFVEPWPAHLSGNVIN